jgi:hypothetical protein
MKPFCSDHGRLDERSLALHELVAQKVQVAPPCWTRHERIYAAGRRPAAPLRRRWRNGSGYSAALVTAFLVERSEKAARLAFVNPARFAEF